MTNFFTTADKIRVVLTDDDFKTLISGGIVRRSNVSIALSDIGFSRMTDLLIQACEEYFGIDRKIESNEKENENSS